MVKPDEIALMRLVLPRGVYNRNVDYGGPLGCSNTVGRLCDEVGMHWKRARYILRDKWADRRDWYDYGTGWSSGWLTPEGMVALPKVLAKHGRDEETSNGEP